MADLSDLASEIVPRCRYAGEANSIRAMVRTAIEIMTYHEPIDQQTTWRNLQIREHLIQVAHDLESLIGELLQLPTVQHGDSNIWTDAQP